MKRQDLEQLYYLEKELEMWERELSDLKAQYPIRSPLPSTARAASITDKVSERGNKLVDLEAKIKQRRDLINEIYTFIERIPDAQMRLIIKSRCQNADNWDETLDIIGSKVSVDNIKKKYYRFLDELSG